MSVTFGIPGIPSLIKVTADGCDGLYGCIESQWDCGCEFIDGPGVNMANDNAISVLGALGIEADFEYGIVGSMKVEDFLGHVLAAEATYGEDLGFADCVTPGGGTHLDLDECDHWKIGADGQPRCAHGATFIDCGRPAGYINTRLAELRDLCEQARSMGATEIQWA